MALNNQRAFLRSINLVYDVASVDCVEHFYPTTKAVALISAVMGLNANERAHLVIAPYGSGKSLAATYALQVIENRPIARQELISVAKRMQSFADDLYQEIIARISGDSAHRRGIAVALHGTMSNLAGSIKKGALDSISRLGLGDKAEHLEKAQCDTAESLTTFLRHLLDFSNRQKIKQIAIIWDEFGKHLERLVIEGRTAELIEVQQLAEICSRQQKIPMTLTLLMHQGFSSYAVGLPQAVRNEWSKVAGRFREIRYVDNSKEIYNLIGRIMNQDQHTKAGAISAKLGVQLQKLGLFKQFKKQELLKLLNDAIPLDPITLYLLPRISARVAQNERTLFSFLNDLDDQLDVGPDAIYDYFSNEMHADISVGGTNKQWLQAESAITLCDGDEKQAKAIKCACLLGMGLQGERTKAPQELLIMALMGRNINNRDEAIETVNQLIRRKLLLYRRYNDSISVWHGTDFDVRGRLEELKSRNREQFDVVDFLNKEAPPRAWRPLRYNAKYRLCRYCPGFYADLRALDRSDLLDLEKNGYYTDAKLIYFIPNDEGEIKKAQRWAENITSSRIGVFIPSKPIALYETALEVSCLIELSLDHKLISQDPLLRVEIAQMLDDARSYLQQLTDRFTIPGDEVLIYFGGENRDTKTREELNEDLSKLMEDVFPLTPVVNNELIVRRNVSKPIQNARKKLVMGILEQAGEKASFGFSDTEMRTPQASMYRSVLVHTELYDIMTPRFREPEEIDDKGMREIWSELKAFYSDTGNDRCFDKLLTTLQNPPYGVRAALLPILLAAGYKAFARSVVLCGPFGYLNDLMSSTFEQICIDPAEYSVRVTPLTGASEKYLAALAWLFFYGEENSDEKAMQGVLNRKKEVLRQVYEAFCKWRAELPAAALSADSVSDEVFAFQQILKKRDFIPDELFLATFPQAMKCDGPGPNTVKAIARVINELTNIVSTHQKQAEKVIRDAFLLSSKGNIGLLDNAKNWASCFPEDFRVSVPDLVARRIFSLVTDYDDSDERFVDELALILVGKGVIHWDSGTFERFSEKLNDVISKTQRLLFQRTQSNTSNKGIQNLLKSEARKIGLRMIEFGLSRDQIANYFQEK